MNLKNILRLATKMEKDSEDFYNYCIDEAKSESAKKLFEELKEIETRHYYDLVQKSITLGIEETPKSLSWVIDKNEASFDPHIIADISDIAQLSNSGMQYGVTDLNILRMAFLMKNDLIFFYKNLLEQVSDNDVKKLIADICEWEEREKANINRKYQEMLRDYWKDFFNQLK